MSEVKRRVKELVRPQNLITIRGSQSVTEVLAAARADGEKEGYQNAIDDLKNTLLDWDGPASGEISLRCQIAGLERLKKVRYEGTEY